MAESAFAHDCLAGQVAVITGAGRGIGRALALGFAAHGADIALCARREADIAAVAEQVTGLGRRALALVGDVRDEHAMRRLFQRSEAELGGVNLVLANAGISSEPRHVTDSDPAAWRETLEVNLFGAYLTARAAIPALTSRGGGKIVLLGSGLGLRGMPGGSAYGCAKAGVHLLTQTLAVELRDKGITVNELIPGPVVTDLPRAFDLAVSDAPEASAEWNKQPEDVLPLALFLATQPATGPTGQSFSLMRRNL